MKASHRLARALNAAACLGLLAARELQEGKLSPARRVADTLGRELGWDSERVARELDRFGAEARAEGLAARVTTGGAVS